MNENIPLIEVRNLKKVYCGKKSLFSSGENVHAVNNVNFQISRGETFGLIGESGSGKSTIGRMILKLIEPTDGKILYDGRSVTQLSNADMRKFRSKVQIIFQDSGSAFNPRRPIGQQMAYPLIKLKKEDKEKAMKQVYDSLELVGLRKDFATRYPHELSGGQRQRAGIARALVLNPEFVVLDEPVSALDVSVRAQIINLLEKLQKEYHLTYLFIAHNLDLVAHFCNRVAVMYKGTIVETNKTENIFRYPQNKITKKLLGSILTLDGSLGEIKGDTYKVTSF